MPDHLDRYASMDEYIDDKKNIYRAQDIGCVTIAGNDNWGKCFLSETKGRPLIYADSERSLGENQSGGWIGSDGRGFARFYGWNDANDETAELVPESLKNPGNHNKMNMLCASLAAYSLGVKPDVIKSAAASFSGIEHRLERFHEAFGMCFYNDSAATIPQAAAACIEALSPLILVTGGTDKNLDFSPLSNAVKKAVTFGSLRSVILLAGTGSEKLRRLLAETGVPYHGPFDNLDEAVNCAIGMAREGDNIALSPGCASFGMFLNEFDRGRKWKEAIMKMTNEK